VLFAIRMIPMRKNDPYVKQPVEGIFCAPKYNTIVLLIAMILSGAFSNTMRLRG
jgi:hypothetical protein